MQEESLHCNHVYLLIQTIFNLCGKLSLHFLVFFYLLYLFNSVTSVIRGEKTRRVYSEMLQKHRAAIVVQRNIKCQAARKSFINTRNASVVIQSGKNLLVLG